MRIGLFDGIGGFPRRESVLEELGDVGYGSDTVARAQR